MSQGKEYTKEEKDKIIYEALKPYFLLGQPLARACINAKIPYTTFKTWYDQDEALRIEVESWRNYKYSKSEEILIDSVVKERNTENAKFILKTGLKEEYSERTEATNTNYNANIPLSPEDEEAIRAYIKRKSKSNISSK